MYIGGLSAVILLILIQEFLEKNHPLSMIIRAHECVMVDTSMGDPGDGQTVTTCHDRGWFRTLCQWQIDHGVQCHGAQLKTPNRLGRE
jgi:hypothetical protein